MSRRRLRRRLIWAAAVLGLVLLYVGVTMLRVCVWSRDVLAQRPRLPALRRWA